MAIHDVHLMTSIVEQNLAEIGAVVLGCYAFAVL